VNRRGLTTYSADAMLMPEPTRRSELDVEDVQAKTAADEWCRHATAYAPAHPGKPWRHVLLPQDVISENVSLQALAPSYAA